jgi:AAA family ATPase
MATQAALNFFAVKGPELLNMYVGESERAIRRLFEQARDASPSIIFFDEIDCFGGQRSTGVSKGSGSVNMLTALLTEMDGFESMRGVLVLAATNRPDALDPALLRPGRFDRRVYVGLPKEAAREAIFKIKLKGVPLADDVDCANLAKMSEGFSGAEIMGICQEARWKMADKCVDEDGVSIPGIPFILNSQLLVDSLSRATKGVTEEQLKVYAQFREKC